MMDKKETLQKIKDSLKSLIKFSDELKDSKFGNFDLTDGTKITTPAEDLEIGADVFSLDDQGNQTPLDDGEYVLTDGRTITVKGNKIEAISGGESEESEQPEGEVSEEEESKEQKLEDGLPEEHPAEADGEAHDDIKSRIADLEKQIEDILNIIKKLGATQGEVNEQMMSKFNSLSNENGDRPIKTKYRESMTSYEPGKSNFSEELRDFLKKKKK